MYYYNYYYFVVKDYLSDRCAYAANVVGKGFTTPEIKAASVSRNLDARRR
jgi:hypothetical protein